MKHVVGDAARQLDDRVALVARRGDVEEDELVGALGVVALGELDGIAGVADVDEVRALDDAAGVDVEAGDDALEVHSSRVAAVLNRKLSLPIPPTWLAPTPTSPAPSCDPLPARRRRRSAALAMLGLSALLAAASVLWARLGDGSLRTTAVAVAATTLRWALVRLVGRPRRAAATPPAAPAETTARRRATPRRGAPRGAHSAFRACAAEPPRAATGRDLRGRRAWPRRALPRRARARAAAPHARGSQRRTKPASASPSSAACPSATVNRRSYSALPTITPPRLTCRSAASAARSSSVPIPPEYMKRPRTTAAIAPHLVEVRPAEHPVLVDVRVDERAHAAVLQRLDDAGGGQRRRLRPAGGRDDAAARVDADDHALAERARRRRRGSRRR